MRAIFGSLASSDKYKVLGGWGGGWHHELFIGGFLEFHTLLRLWQLEAKATLQQSKGVAVATAISHSNEWTLQLNVSGGASAGWKRTDADGHRATHCVVVEEEPSPCSQI